MSRILSIDYGDARVGIAITDALNITAQGLETIQRNNSDKIILKRLDEIFEQYEVKTIVIGMPYNMNGTKTERAEVTEKFIHKLKCKYPDKKIATVDERLTTVAAHKTMNYLEINPKKKKSIVDTISAVYILETFINQQKTLNQYSKNYEDLTSQIEKQKEYNEQLSKKKQDIESTDFIEDMAREKLDMYLPNEKVYMDTGY